MNKSEPKKNIIKTKKEAQTFVRQSFGVAIYGVFDALRCCDAFKLNWGDELLPVISDVFPRLVAEYMAEEAKKPSKPPKKKKPTKKKK